MKTGNPNMKAGTSVQNPIGTQLVLEALAKFPDHPNLTIAKRLFKDNPKVWRSVEGARDSVRYFRGARGNRNRKTLVIKGFIRPRGVAGADPVPTLPKSEEKEWFPYMIEGERIGILPDIHIPYHNTMALEAALEFLKDHKVDTILLNGDQMDCYQASRFDKDPRRRKLKDELDATRQFLDYLAYHFPNVKIIWRDGNHEQRYEALLRVSAPALIGIPEFQINNLLTLEDREIDYVTNKQIIQVGKHLSIIHGHEFREAIMAPVNAARGLFIRAKGCAITSHLHQTSEHTETTIQGKIIGTWSTGCLCELHPDYMPLNRWSHGFAVVYSDGEDFEVLNKKIIKGKVY